MSSFWKSDLIKGIEGGELPTVKTEIFISTDSLIKLTVATVSVVALVFLLKVLTNGKTN